MGTTLSGAALEKVVSDGYWWAGAFLLLLAVVGIVAARAWGPDDD